MTIPVEITETYKMAVEKAQQYERRRAVGIVLKAYAEAKLAGEWLIADALDRLATEIENS